uniref:Uncharacterized protein n=1 Tax=Chromera velia CCMP2878 TaxID=1169474 RepID=A0A0G4H554_9ALVE|eukprot:Cvel_24717.t1-p1 / transcript=Cvel_24717.t1 / gene=Cvel_24717 / organism=Chromera_velia_CCMP2878 / gene_product=hypothetical protein / transcript_product=hypothetical protein / location=Cvel_scaffold2712:11714-12034(-) / protein_length=107 / sequence_SO=supercontig / SO=protein_coding / is_pseudo=false
MCGPPVPVLVSCGRGKAGFRDRPVEVPGSALLPVGSREGFVVGEAAGVVSSGTHERPADPNSATRIVGVDLESGGLPAEAPQPGFNGWAMSESRGDEFSAIAGSAGY